LHEWLHRAFASIGVTTHLSKIENKPAPGRCFIGAEQFDLVQGTLKIAGAAQRRNRQGLLIQGSVQQATGTRSRAEWEEAMLRTAAFCGPSEWQEFNPDRALVARVEELAMWKYSQRAYLERR
jgi:lipoate-protein ligase A